MIRAWTTLTTAGCASQRLMPSPNVHRLFTHKQGIHTTVSRCAVTKFFMPAMSPTMTEGAITSWKLKEGDSFSAGDVLLEIETDKAQIDVEAQDDGYLAKILSPAGVDKIAVNQVIALLAEEGDTLTKEDLDVASKGPSTISTPAEAPKTHNAPTGKPAPSVPEKQMKKSEMVYFPSVARLIAENELDPMAIQGTGPKGRLLKGDVLNFLKHSGGMKTQSKATRKSSPNQVDASSSILPKASNAKSTVPRFVLQREIPLGNGAASNRIPLFIQAASKALRATPHLNIQYTKNPHYSPEAIDDILLATEYLKSESNNDKSNEKTSVEISLRGVHGSEKRVVYKNADQVKTETKAPITMELLKQSMVKTNDGGAKAVGLSSSTFAATYDRAYFEAAMEPTYINVAETGETSNKETYTELIDYFGGKTLAKHEPKQPVAARASCPSEETEDCSFLNGIASPAVKTNAIDGRASKKERETCTVSFSFDHRLVDPVVAEEFVDMVEKFAQSAKQDVRAA